MSGLRTQIIRIGNSQGIRIPKALLEQCHLAGDVFLEPEGDRLVVRSVKGCREGWDGAFETMAQQGDDELLDDGAPGATKWDQEEWEW